MFIFVHCSKQCYNYTCFWIGAVAGCISAHWLRTMCCIACFMCGYV